MRWSRHSPTSRRCPTCARPRSSFRSSSCFAAAPTSRCLPTTRACRFHMSARRRTRARGISVWVIALLVALVATIQLRSEVEVARSLVGVDPTSLAFLIDDLHRGNDSLDAEKADLGQRRAALQSGEASAADQVLTEESNRLRALEGQIPVQGPGIVIVIDAGGLTALEPQDALNNLSAGGAQEIGRDNRRVLDGGSPSQTRR